MRYVSADRWIVIPRWEEFQHYKDRDPKWIKVYTRLLASQSYLALSFRQRGILHGIWMLYAASGRELGASPARLGLMLGDPTVRARDLISLEQAGFLQLSLAPCKQDASLDLKEEKEKEVPLTLIGSDGPGRPIAKAMKGEGAVTEHDVPPKLDFAAMLRSMGHA